MKDPRTETLATDLRSAGFSDFALLDSEAVSAQVNASPDRQSRYLQEYEDAAYDGIPIVAIVVEDEEQAGLANDVLQRNHVLNVRYFDRDAVRDLSANSNPSA